MTTPRPKREPRRPQTLRATATQPAVFHPDAVRPPTREEMTPILLLAVFVAFLALIISFSRGYLLLYGDAVAHLGIARRLLDTRNPGLVQLGGVWLPLPHLLMLPFIWKMQWWQSGLAGAWPSLLCFVAGIGGFYRLCRRMLAPRWALVATAFYGLNPNLLYLATTAMSEPLFLALLVWMTLVTMQCVDAICAADHKIAARRMVALGLLIFASVFTRYDGWIVGAAAWCVVAWHLWRNHALQKRLLAAFSVLTFLAIAGPLLWLGYNQHFYHDPLDFMRGPYSAPAIEKKTSPPGAKHYRGWHNPGWALLFYTRTAQVDAAAGETGFALMAAALAGLWIVLRRKMDRTSALLWVPLPFYVYSVAYGSVPIFIPQLYPHSYYNARYGMEMLPALALFGAVAAAAWERRLIRSAAPQSTGPIQAAHPALIGPARWLYLCGIALAVANPLAMIFGPSIVQAVAARIEHRPSHLLANYAPPLVLKEALVNATTRVPFELNVALVLEELPPGTAILMGESDHIGALQVAGIPLRQTINETDWDSWHAALEDPAGQAAYVISFDGDEVAKAVAAHPRGLELLSITCGTGQPCARLYQSNLYLPPAGGAAK